MPSSSCIAFGIASSSILGMILVANGSMGSGGKYTAEMQEFLYSRYRRRTYRRSAIPISPIGTPTATPMIVGRLLLGVGPESGSASTTSVGIAKSLEMSDAVEVSDAVEASDVVEVAVAPESLGDVGVTGSFEIIGIVLLIVTVTTKGSVGSVGDTVITDVLTSVVIGGAGAGAVEMALVVRSSIQRLASMRQLCYRT